MAIHTKPANESMTEFLKRIRAWNNGEPVPSVDIQQKSAHQFRVREGYTFCSQKSCYAEARGFHAKDCPQDVGWWSWFGLRGVKLSKQESTK